jgi:hypothetical protein
MEDGTVDKVRGDVESMTTEQATTEQATTE